MNIFNRFGGSGASQQSQTKVFAGPTRGLVKNESLAVGIDRAAERLDNFFPTPQGARMRAGSIKHATIGAAVKALMIYDTGGSKELFAADANNIYDITTPADADVAPTASVTGQTSGDWSDTQFATSGGNFLIAVNGSDAQQLYDGSQWFPIDSNDIFGLAFDAQTADFTVGETVTGSTSSATATIVQQTDSGTTGTLYVKSISGTFQNNETITDGAGGSATSDIPSGVTTKYTGITGVATSGLSHVWQFKKRIFYIEDGTLSAWYLDTLSIGGTATEFVLKGLFTKGGSLLFGGTWSQDAGDGLDDYCIFVTTEGEVAVYEGTNPSNASTWTLVGVYQIGKPLGKNSHFKAGGDIGVVCDDGIIPLSAAISKTGAALSGAAITFPIEDEWREIIRNREGTGNFPVVLWHNKTALLVGIPTPAGYEDIMLVANSRTGAWCRYTGWPATSMVVLDDTFYFGKEDATIIQGETGGDDLDTSYSAVWVPRFDMLGTPEEKVALHARIMARLVNDITPQLFAASDYAVDVPAPLPADPEISTSTWGSGVWGTATWGAQQDITTLSDWQSVAAVGQALAPGLQITSGRADAPNVEIVSLYLQYQTGRVMG